LSKIKINCLQLSSLFLPLPQLEKPQKISDFKQKALHWANQFEVCCFLDSNDYKDAYSAYDFIIAADAKYELKCSAGKAFDQLKSFYTTHKQWIFGFFSYDLKNEIEDLSSNHSDNLGFPDLYFFVPKYLIAFKDGNAEVLLGHHSILADIESFQLQAKNQSKAITIAQRLSKDQYIQKVEALRDHMIRGDIYEVNFCQEFFAENAEIDPVQIFEGLNKVSPTPFAGYFKVYDKYILSATPERFLCNVDRNLPHNPSKARLKEVQIWLKMKP
jgi:para-aminobenzoate synthetase component 1